jgi:putative membrane protein
MSSKIYEILSILPEKSKQTSVFFVLFYLVGIIGLSLPLTFPLFLKLVPFALILSLFALVLFHRARFDGKTIAVFSGIILAGILVEAIGVNTGIIFGRYEYGNSLGLKIFNTPILIGINWFLLVYTSSSVLEQFKFHVALKIVVASIFMLVYDVVLEQLAPKMDMWLWENDRVPLQNYLAWFLIALVFHSVLKFFKIDTKNKIALVILLCQFLFFLILLVTG